MPGTPAFYATACAPIFGYLQAAKEFPELIWCSITGFGQDGPYAQWAGHDLTYTAHSGLLTGINRDLSWHPQVVLAVPLGAMMAATGSVSALYERQRTGQGTHLDISLAESATWLLSGSDGEINGDPWGIPVGADRRLYECGDGRYVTVAAAEPRTWAALTTASGSRIWPRVVCREETTSRQHASASQRYSPPVPPPNECPSRRTIDGPVAEDAPTPPPEVGADTWDVLKAAGYSSGDIDGLIAAGDIDGLIAAGDIDGLIAAGVVAG